MHEMRSRFLAGLCKEIWSMLEDDLVDAKVAHGLLVGCERATDKAKTDPICSLAEFNNYMRQSRVKSVYKMVGTQNGWKEDSRHPEVLETRR